MKYVGLYNFDVCGDVYFLFIKVSYTLDIENIIEI